MWGISYNSMCKDNIKVGGITLYVEDKGGGHHSVFGHIPVQKEKYYIIRIKKWLFGNRLLHLYIKSFTCPWQENKYI
jgi:hypothetical protein